LGRPSQGRWNHEKRGALDFHQHLNKLSKRGNAGRISGQVARPGKESGKTISHEPFQTSQGRTVHADVDMGTALSSPASTGNSGFWKQRSTQYPALRQLSGHRLLAAAGSSAATGCPFGTHAGLRKQRDAQYATLWQLSGLRFLAAAGSSTATARPFGPHPGLGPKRHDKHPAKRRDARHRHIPGPGAVEKKGIGIPSVAPRKECLFSISCYLEKHRS
jgi:hypothetical protein